MPRETKAQKTDRIALLLADYDAKSRELRKLHATVDAMKDEINANVPAGTYGEWMRSHGTAREILDQKKVRELFKDRGEDLPMKMTEPPIVVSHVVK